MMKASSDKMIKTEHQAGAPLYGFHFSGAGSKTGPIIVKAASREEAENMYRAMNADTVPKKSTATSPSA